MIKSTISLALFAFSSSATMAACSTNVVMAVDLVGHDITVVQYKGDYPTVPRFVSEHEGFMVNPLEQTGPMRWGEDMDADPILMGTNGTVVGIAGTDDEDRPIAYYVELEDGRQVVLNLLKMEPYDFTACEPSVLLADHGSELTFRQQWMTYLPLKLKPDARPIDYRGDWIEKEFLEALVLLDCTSYDDKTSYRPESFHCVPVWRDGSVDVDRFDTPTEIYPTADQVEYATIEDLRR